MYVDAAAGVTSLGLAPLTGGSGYWHVGWADFTGVTPPSSAYFHGSLSGSFVTASATSGGTRSTLFGATSASDFQTKVLALSGVVHLWMLGDSGTTTFTGTLPTSMTAPCTKVNVAMAFTGPAASIAIGTLAALANNIPRSVAAPGPGATQTLTTSTSRATGYNTDISGLHLYAPITIRETTNPASSSWQLDFTWNDATSVFLA
jgi:hypothetical protein